METSESFKTMERYILNLQNLICVDFEKINIKTFNEDKWKHKDGGGGITRIFSGGNFIEKGGVNFSSVKGFLPEIIAQNLGINQQNFAACGLSIIIHPFSPKIPTIHMNIRYFETENEKSWFGGGIDLTPYFPYEEDFILFHSTLKNACNSVIENSYGNFKKQCDEYFTIKHRNEMRGIGGIFYDYLDGKNPKHFNLIKSTGNSYLKCYLPIVNSRLNEKYSEEDKNFQLIRRGRYIEFNLIYDRGTLFGLKTGGRIESILVSMPPLASFIYDYKSSPNSPHSKMEEYYQPKDWI